MVSGVRKKRSKRKAKMIPLPCACATLRRTARLVTQLYEEALRPAGITGPQFTLLQALTLAPGISQKRLAEILGADSTTLTRTLAIIEKRGLIKAEAAADRRAWQLGLTKAGQREYERALPYWQSAQSRLRRALGDPKWNVLIEALIETAEAIQ